MENRGILVTHTGHKLSEKEYKFIHCVIESGNQAQSVREAGYKTNNPRSYGAKLAAKGYISEEIEYLTKQMLKTKITSAENILQFFTDVMEARIKDENGKSPKISERLDAAKELAKRLIDIPNKGKNENNEIKIILDWSR